MNTCPVCHCLLAYHTDAMCIEGAAGRQSVPRPAPVAQAQVASGPGAQVAAIRCILRNLLAVPYREFATSKATTVVAIAMSDEQYRALKRFAESD